MGISRYLPTPITPLSHYTCATCGVYKEVACFKLMGMGRLRGLPYRDCKECQYEKRKAVLKARRALEPTPPRTKATHIRNYKEWREAFEQEQHGRRIAGRASVPPGERTEGATVQASADGGGGLQRDGESS